MNQPDLDTTPVRAALSNVLDAFFEKRPDHVFRAAVHDFLNKLRVTSLEALGASKTGQEQNAAFFTPPQLAKEWGVDADKILGWIRSGQSIAINMVTTTGGRPRYRISAEEAQAFQKRRSSASPPQSSPRTKPSKDDDTIEFY
jgi:hypothetical protein